MPKFLSRADLERIAGTIVDQYYKTVPRMGTLPSPVNPVAVAREVMGLDVRYLPLSDDGAILGLACFRETELEVYDDDGTPFQIRLAGRDIVIDSSLLGDGKTGRHNFTAAHELAHHVLVRLYPEDYSDLLNCGRRVLYRDERRQEDWVEWQANVLGACILMPAETIRNCMYMFGMNDKADMAGPARRAKEYGKFCDIATYLGVSRKALAVRMKRLGLLGEGYPENPTAPVDIMERGGRGL